MALFWLKLNEINFLENKFNKKPIVLLDDVFSELDFYNKQLISRLVKSYQTIITTAEIEVLNFIEAPKSIIKL
jgi:DNA replication and repair protein RecF